ncbi:MAG: hypothetical protein JXM79_18570 [Sedimentisphaerales bacterium]|nr:hypothetical protein [Sedimentisphaerales bacterium]
MKRQSILISSIIVIWSYTANADPIQWSISDGGNGHFYELIVAEDSIPWTEARNRAFSVNGYLATITSEAENVFVYSLVPHPMIYGPYLGGFQPEGSPEPDGNWQWVTGEPFVYTNWHIDNPSDSRGEEDYLHFSWDSGGEWNDISLDYGIGDYIVEYNCDPTIIPTPSAFLLGTLGLSVAGWKLRRRKE